MDTLKTIGVALLFAAGIVAVTFLYGDIGAWG